jgi:hypothetical protein
VGVELQTRSFKFGPENNLQLEYVQDALGCLCENSSQAVRQCIANTFMEIRLYGPDRVIQRLLDIKSSYQLELF